MGGGVLKTHSQKPDLTLSDHYRKEKLGGAIMAIIKKIPQRDVSQVQVNQIIFRFNGM